MSRTCPNCRYVRQPNDAVPEWQCPACAKAYNKGAGAPVDARHGRSPALEKRAAPGSERFKWMLVLALLGAGIWLAGAFDKPGADRVGRPGEAPPEVTLYSTSWCGYCAAARDFFAANDIRYTELDVEKSALAAENHRRLGGKGVPLIVIGDDVVPGYNESQLRTLLKPWLKRS